jgi:hypothetical protein
MGVSHCRFHFSTVIPALGVGIHALGIEEGVDPGTKSRDDDRVEGWL